MKQVREYFRFALVAVVGATMLVTTAQAQLTGQDAVLDPPFDFSNRFYAVNGVEPDALIDRRDGNDRRSVIDSIFDRNHREVRITQTFPATNSDGKLVFWNHYADLPARALKLAVGGGEASAVAYRYPIYMFPSSKVPGGFRQAAILTTDDDYFGKNPLGLALVILIEYTDYARSKKGQSELRERLGDRILSLDDDPVVLTVDEVNVLLRAGLISQRVRGAGNGDIGASRIVAKQIADPRFGAIRPDAFLELTRDANGSPLSSEIGMLQEFECLQTTGAYCKN